MPNPSGANAWSLTDQFHTRRHTRAWPTYLSKREPRVATNFITTKIDGRIAVVRFDRGDKANALSVEAIRQLTEAARAFHANSAVSAIVLTGNGRNFTLGADLKDPARADQKAQGLAERRLSLRAGPDMCEAWEKVDAITIIAIEGWCVGGGAALAVACDLRVMAKSATVYVPEVARGMNMSWGSIPRMTALVGPARAKRLAALCEKVDAQTALGWGLADAVADEGNAFDRAMEFARMAAQLPPTALKMVKRDVNVAAFALSQATAHRDLEAFALMQQSDDYTEGVASFLEGSTPTFTGD